MYRFQIENCIFDVSRISNMVIKNNIDGHKHSNGGYELHFIRSGSGVVITENEKYEVKKGSLYVTGPNVYHKQLTEKQNPMNEICIYLELRKNGGGKIANVFLENKFWFGTADSEVESIINSLLLSDETDCFYKELSVSAYLQLLIVAMVKLYSPPVETRDEEILSSRMRIIDDEFLFHCDEITLSSLSKKIGVSQRQTQRILKESFSKSFYEKKREAQMEKATELLNSNRTVEDTALSCGFCDSSAFSSAFKKAKGVSPREYRKNK